MLDRLKYVNHLGESVQFGTSPFFINQNDLRNYEWKYDNTNEKISDFNKKSIVTKDLPIVVMEGADLNAMFEVFEKDVIAGQFGKLYSDDYYLNCYVYKSAKTDYLNGSYKKLTLSIAMQNSNWIKASKYQGFADADESETLGRDYDRKYPYGYTSANHEIRFSTLAVSKSGFELIIYGTASNPSIYINNHLYGVNVAVAAGEYLTINSIDKTITLTKASGTKYNYFQFRNKESNIFEPLASGTNSLTWSGNFSFDLTVFEERSEPTWT